MLEFEPSNTSYNTLLTYRVINRREGHMFYCIIPPTNSICHLMIYVSFVLYDMHIVAGQAAVPHRGAPPASSPSHLNDDAAGYSPPPHFTCSLSIPSPPPETEQPSEHTCIGRPSPAQFSHCHSRIPISYPDPTPRGASRFNSPPLICQD